LLFNVCPSTIFTTSWNMPRQIAFCTLHPRSNSWFTSKIRWILNDSPDCYADRTNLRCLFSTSDTENSIMLVSSIPSRNNEMNTHTTMGSHHKILMSLNQRKPIFPSPILLNIPAIQIFEVLTRISSLHGINGNCYHLEWVHSHTQVSTTQYWGLSALGDRIWTLPWCGRECTYFGASLRDWITYSFTS
jgi:hypothetical protein